MRGDVDADSADKSFKLNALGVFDVPTLSLSPLHRCLLKAVDVIEGDQTVAGFAAARKYLEDNRSGDIAARICRKGKRMGQGALWHGS